MPFIFEGEAEIPSTFKAVYEAPYKKVMFDESGRTILTLWNHHSLNITEEEYKKDAIYFVDLLLQYKATNLVADNRGNIFPLTSEIQRWYKESISHLIGNHKMHKWAVVLDENLLLYNLLDEVSSRAKNNPSQKNAEFRFFTNNQQALIWLNR